MIIIVSYVVAAVFAMLPIFCTGTRYLLIGCVSKRVHRFSPDPLQASAVLISYRVSERDLFPVYMYTCTMVPMDTRHNKYLAYKI
jgi:hypothetical protein